MLASVDTQYNQQILSDNILDYWNIVDVSHTSDLIEDMFDYWQHKESVPNNYNQ